MRGILRVWGLMGGDCPLKCWEGWERVGALRPTLGIRGLSTPGWGS